MAQKLLSLPKVPTDTNYVPVRRDVWIPWVVGVTNPGSYCWTLESTVNFVDWKEEIVPVVPFLGSFCISGDPTVYATNPATFYRLHGVQILP